MRTLIKFTFKYLVTLLLTALLIWAAVHFYQLPDAQREAFLLDYVAVRSRFDLRVLAAPFFSLSALDLITAIAVLWLIGSRLELALKTRRYLLLILCCCALPWAAFLWRYPDTPGVGASGLLMGILGAAAAVFLRSMLLPVAFACVLWLLISSTQPIGGIIDVYVFAVLVGLTAAYILAPHRAQK